MSVTAPEPSDVPDPEPPENVFVAAFEADVRAVVEHHAPCVPECRVCYPEGED